MGKLFPLVINTTKNLNKAGSDKYLSQESIKLECDYASLEKAAFFVRLYLARSAKRVFKLINLDVGVLETPSCSDVQ